MAGAIDWGRIAAEYRPEYADVARRTFRCGLNPSDEDIAYVLGADAVRLACWAICHKEFYDAITPSQVELDAIAERNLQRQLRAGQRRAAWKRRRWLANPGLRIEAGMRARLWHATKGTVKSISGLPYSMDELRAHLERLFQPGMRFANYGQWHIDHIRPCCTFNQLDPEQFAQCWALANLQPLWARDNLRKSHKYGGPKGK